MKSQAFNLGVRFVS